MNFRTFLAHGEANISTNFYYFTKYLILIMDFHQGTNDPSYILFPVPNFHDVMSY